MYIEIIFLLVAACFALFLITVTRLEKQHVKEYVPAGEGEPADPSPYFAAMNAAAETLGFTRAGVFLQKREGRIYQDYLALWVAPGREILLRIVGGKVAGIPCKKTTLITFLDNGQMVETADDFGMKDISGLTQSRVLLNAHLAELLAFHRQRLQMSPETRRAFSETTALQACEAMCMMKAVRMVECGLARFTNRERTVWRHTLKGAVQGYLKGFRAQWAEAKTQAGRAKLKRPGDQ